MPETPTFAEKYDLARDHLKHEDGLINQRITWFLVFQGLLFTALMAGLALLDPGKNLPPTFTRFIAVVCTALIVLASVSALVAHALVRAAYWHVDDVHNWWEAQFPPSTNTNIAPEITSFPPLRGTGIKPKNRRHGGVTAAAFLLVLAFVWVVLLATAAPVLWTRIVA